MSLCLCSAMVVAAHIRNHSGFSPPLSLDKDLHSIHHISLICNFGPQALCFLNPCLLDGSEFFLCPLQLSVQSLILLWVNTREQEMKSAQLETASTKLTFWYPSINFSCSFTVLYTCSLSSAVRWSPESPPAQSLGPWSLNWGQEVEDVTVQ